MYLTILFLPFLASIIAGTFGRKLGNSGAPLITISSLSITSILVLVAFFEVGLAGNSTPVHINLSLAPEGGGASWIDSELLTVNWGFTFDSLSIIMLIPILFVSTLVQIYTVWYVADDPHQQRFFSYLTMFTCAMIVLVTADNYLVMFTAWEAVGVISYLLISFWYTRVFAAKSAVLAMTQNRVGDTLLTLGLFTIFIVFGSLEFSTVFSLAPFVNENSLTIICLFLLGGAAAKSAQLILNTWLPFSMEGPTPVSSLLHAATLVVCGIYLLVRSSPILEFSPTALLVITWVGAVTSIFAASSGLFQNDLKRIIAFSTISQLGYMMIAIGLSQYDVALLHMSSHAFFKALLFLCAGAIIHSFSDNQDIRKFGGLQYFLPLIYSAVVIGSLSLMALPWLSGFYSKDLILEFAYAQYSFTGFSAYVLGTITAGLTAFYSFKLISLVFLGRANATDRAYNNVHESPLPVIIPLVILSLLSIFYGYIASDLFIGFGTSFFGNSVFIHPSHVVLPEAEFSIPLAFKLLPTVLSILGAALAIYLYNYREHFLFDLSNNYYGKRVYNFFNGKYYLDIIYNQFIIKGGMYLGLIISTIFDKGILELVGPTGLNSNLSSTAFNISKLDNGIITNYALAMIIAIITLLTFVFSNSLPASEGEWASSDLTTQSWVNILLVPLRGLSIDTAVIIIFALLFTTKKS